MDLKSSTFVEETLERESWLQPTVEREGGTEEDLRHCVATAALVRGALNAIPVPPASEERARREAAEAMNDHLLGRSERPAEAPWYLKVGHRMRHVFTIVKKK